MNILIFTPEQFIHDDQARLSARQSKHVQSILKSQPGDQLQCGLLNGNIGVGELDMSNGELYLRNITLKNTPPKALKLRLLLALPRPQMLKRILQTVAIFGVEELILMQTTRVEKSFWQSPSATDTAIQEQMILGLEQAKATQLPKVVKINRFRALQEDYVAKLGPEYIRMIAHPGEYPMCPSNCSDAAMAIAIGPEGGFTEYEVDQFIGAGFQPFQMGERILKVETAVNAVLGRLI